MLLKPQSAFDEDDSRRAVLLEIRRPQQLALQLVARASVTSGQQDDARQRHPTRTSFCTK